MNKYFLIALFFSLFFFSCEDKLEEPGVEMEFGETQCANPWDALPGSDSYLLAVHQFLTENGIEIYSVSVELINGGNGIYCNACNCPSGRKVVIRIPESDIKNAEHVGFSLIH